MSTRFERSKGVYVIAEVGINHNGRIDEAKHLIRSAVESGADGVKIQVRDLDSLYTSSVLADPLLAEQSTQYLLSELRKAHFTHDQVRELFEFARAFDADFFATPFDPKSALFLNELGMELFKIGSPDLTNLPLIDLVCGFAKPMVLSTGMCTEAELLQVLAFLKARRADFALLHCNSTYPAADCDINLRYIDTLRKHAATGTRVGYSGHEQGASITLAAVALGAQIIERHITRDRAQAGPDHRASLTVEQFGELVREIRRVEQALGVPAKLFNQGERSNRLSLAKSLVAARDLSAGATLSPGDLVAKTPAKGVAPLELEKFLGKKLGRDLGRDEYVSVDHLETSAAAPRTSFRIPKTWGIVGRLNDYRDFLDLKPHLVEIHMTWRDLMEYNSPGTVHEQDLVVHAPEYFKDQLIDFTAPDADVTEMSLEMLRRTIAAARDLNSSFKGQKDPRGPRVVVHPGGHFARMTASNKADQYGLLKRNLGSIDSSGTRILVENMPPFPWYFGGQWYNTIFLDAGEIAQFAQDMGWGVCYDTSHAQLYCNHSGIPLAQFTKTILSHVEYLHISDAKGTTEEGLQIGHGDIDFEQLFQLLARVDTGFIPEIWQGHLSRGRGFKEALAALEEIMSRVSGDSCSKEPG